MNKLSFVIFIFAFCCFQSTAQSTISTDLDSLSLDQTLDEVVVTGTRYSLPLEQSGKSIYKLTEKELEQNAGKTVGDILNEVPGVHIDGNFGSPGTNQSYFVRGGRAKNTLILIDGVPLNDPSGISPFYDLRLLSVSQIQSIEVLKGGLSTLYGTGASAAVINITLKGAEKEGTEGSVDVNYGSFSTANVNASVRETLGKFNYFVSSNYSKSDGFSAALDTTQAQAFDKDGLKSQNSLLKIGYAVNEHLSIHALGAFDKFDTDYDDGAFFDAENKQLGEMLRFGLRPVFTYGKGKVELNAVYAINENDFQSSFPLNYTGRNFQLDLNNKHSLRNSVTGFWGVHVQRMAFDQDQAITFEDSKFSSVAPYASVLYQLSQELNIHAGFRYNQHSEYGSKLVYNVNPSYAFSIANASKIKFYASVATSYITPTGFQLFSLFGNPELGPEESLNYEIGVSLLNGNGLNWNAAYFTREEDNTIGFVSEFDDEGNFIGGAYQNVVMSRTVSGIETDMQYDINNKFSLSGHYTFLNAPENASDFYRIPQNKGGIALEIKPIEKALINLKYSLVGTRKIFNFGSFSEIELESYTLIDLYAQYQLLESKLKIYGSLNNVLDKDFVGVYGFTTRGRNVTVGLRYDF